MFLALMRPGLHQHRKETPEIKVFRSDTQDPNALAVLELLAQ